MIGDPNGGLYGSLAKEVQERTGAASVLVLVVKREGGCGVSVSLPPSAKAFRAMANLLREMCSKLNADAAELERAGQA